MFSRTKCTYADLFGRCPKSLVPCPVATQGTKCFVVDRKSKPQSHCAKEALQAETNSFSRTPIYFEYLVRLSDRCFMDGNHVTAQANWHCETNISYGPYPKSSTYYKRFQAGKKICFIWIKCFLALRDEPLSTRFYDGFLRWFWAWSQCSLFQSPYMTWGEGWARKEGGSRAELFCILLFI